MKFADDDDDDDDDDHGADTTVEASFAAISVNSAQISSCGVVLPQWLLLTYSSVESTSNNSCCLVFC